MHGLRLTVREEAAPLRGSQPLKRSARGLLSFEMAMQPEHMSLKATIDAQPLGTVRWTAR